ncbi:MAG TPA: serine hydrolase [Sphaerochaeta sp.]|nr:serine hydrolase [Sphaerochaeta sp.]
MKSNNIFGIGRFWWFVLASLLLGLLVALLSGSLQFHKKLDPEVTLGEFKLHMDEMIPSMMGTFDIPGCSISLVMDGDIVWSKAYGYADVENGRKLTTDTAMSVQSITKSLTAWGIMKLVENGFLELDVPVSKYLKNWRFPSTEHDVGNVTVRALLSHTAGMPLGDFTDIYAPGEEMPSITEKLTKEAILIDEPGTKFSYSNVGYHLLELLVEEVTGRRFADYMLSEVLVPMGMDSSYFEIDDSLDEFPPTGYDLEGNPVPVYLYPMRSSGGLFATAEDIARFAAAGLDVNPVLSPDYVSQMYAPESRNIGMYSMVFDAYGFGHYVETLPNGMLSVSHGGQGKGIMTHFQVVPETGDAIVILTNSQRSWPFISFVLTEWARWRNFPSVGMGKIGWGRYAMSGLIGMLLSASLVTIMGLYPVYRQRKSSVIQIVKIIIALILIGVLLWCANQPYLFIASVFPILSPWLGVSVLVLSISLVLSVLLAESRRNRVGLD